MNVGLRIALLVVCCSFPGTLPALKIVEPTNGGDVTRLELSSAYATYVGSDVDGGIVDMEYLTDSDGTVDFTIGHFWELSVVHCVSVRFPGGPTATSDIDTAYDENGSYDQDIEYDVSSFRLEPSFNSSGYTFVMVKLIVMMSAQTDSPSGMGYLEWESAEESESW